MAATKPIGWILFLAGLIVAGYGLGVALAPEKLPDWNPQDRTVGWGVLGGGALLLILGFVLIVRRHPIPMSPAPKEPPKPVETVEIKRTEMNWPRAEGRGEQETTDARIEAVQQKMARLKVDFGLGKISPDAFAKLIKELQEQEAEFQRERLRGGAP